MVHCSECKKDIIKHTKYYDWLALMNFMDFLYNEEMITKSSYESMTDKLQTFKTYATD